MSNSTEDQGIGAAGERARNAARPYRPNVRPSETEYFAEHGAALGFPEPIESGRRTYDFNLAGVQSRFQLGGLMGSLTAFLIELGGNYAGGRPELLYYPSKPSDLQILVKPYASMLTKIYRINCLYNHSYPTAPRNGLVEHATLYSHAQMNDLVRTRLVCKYMDGPKFVAEGLARFCKDHELGFRSYPMHNDTGYHAWHCYIRSAVDLVIDGNVVSREMWMELQVTTQLAESITALTHGLYETSRTQSPARTDDEWRWNPRTQQFRSAYLGHTLHLLEGIIQTFRDEVLGITPAAAEDATFNGFTEQGVQLVNPEGEFRAQAGATTAFDPAALAQGAQAVETEIAESCDGNAHEARISEGGESIAWGGGARVAEPDTVEVSARVGGRAAVASSEGEEGTS